MSDVRFIRKNGRLIPIKGKSKGTEGKLSGNPKDALKSKSKTQSYVGGALSGLSAKSHLVGKRKIGLAFGVGAAVANISATVNNIRGSSGVGNFLKTEIANSFRGAAGVAGGFTASHIGIAKGAQAIRKAKHLKKGTVDVLDPSGKVIKSRIGKIRPWQTKLK